MASDVADGAPSRGYGGPRCQSGCGRRRHGRTGPDHDRHSRVAGTGPQRETPDDITLYKGIGIALEDIATAYHVYALAKQQGMGEELDLLR